MYNIILTSKQIDYMLVILLTMKNGSKYWTDRLTITSLESITANVVVISYRDIAHTEIMDMDDVDITAQNVKYI